MLNDDGALFLHHYTSKNLGLVIDTQIEYSRNGTGLMAVMARITYVIDDGYLSHLRTFLRAIASEEFSLSLLSSSSWFSNKLRTFDWMIGLRSRLRYL